MGESRFALVMICRASGNQVRNGVKYKPAGGLGKCVGRTKQTCRLGAAQEGGKDTRSRDHERMEGRPGKCELD